MSYQLYRNTTLGHSLQECLDELIKVSCPWEVALFLVEQIMIRLDVCDVHLSGKPNFSSIGITSAPGVWQSNQQVVQYRQNENNV